MRWDRNYPRASIFHAREYNFHCSSQVFPYNKEHVESGYVDRLSTRKVVSSMQVCLSYLTRSKSILILTLGICLSITSVRAAEDVDWIASVDPIYESGPNTPIVASKWSLGSRRSEIVFSVMFDALLDMTRGNWYGEIAAPEKFFVNIYLLYENGAQEDMNIDDAKARGPDTENGFWKDGPETVEIQSVIFDLTREEIDEIGKADSLVIVYSSFDSKDDRTEIVFPLQSFNDRLADVDTSIRTQGGAYYLLTKDEVEATPLNELPIYVVEQWQDELKDVSVALGKPIEELHQLSNDDIRSLVAAKKAADVRKIEAARRAEHQAIYDQEPDWMDLNLCPKPDVSYCENVGREAYTNDMMVGGDFTFGDIQGVVWRPEGSIFRIHGGSVEHDFAPEIVRARSAGYYYIIRTPEGYLEIHFAEGMLIRL